MNKHPFVGMDINTIGYEKKYYIYKVVNGRKLWVTRNKELSSWIKEKAYVSSWEQAVAITSQIFAGGIK